MSSYLHVVPKFVGLNNDEYQASFWIATDVDVSTADYAEVSTVITDWLQDMYDTVAGQVKNTIDAIEYTIYLHDLLTGEDSFWYDGNWTFVGTASADSLPPQVAATVAASSSGSDRPGQKRMIPFHETTNANGVVGASTLTALANFATEWVRQDRTSTNFNYFPGVISKGSPDIFRAFTGVTYVRDVFGTVKSRKRGLGS